MLPTTSISGEHYGRCFIVKKACVKCGISKPLTAEYFYIRHDSKDGFRNECIICARERKKRYREKNKEKIRKKKAEEYMRNKDRYSEHNKEYYQKNKEKIMQYREENKAHIKKQKKDYRERNKEQIMEYTRRYREKNREYFQEYNKKYREENKVYIAELMRQWQIDNADKVRIAVQRRYALKKSLEATLNLEEWEEIKTIFNNQCAYCGSAEPLEQDHFIPLSKCGEYTKNNIIPACRRCNASKSDKYFYEWYPQQMFYSKKRENRIKEHLNYTTENTQQLSIL